MSVGESLLHAMCEEGDTSVMFQYKLTEDLFQGQEKEIFTFVEQHVEQYVMLPQPETLKNAFPAITASVEPVKYYLDKVDERYKHRRLNLTLQECSNLMKDQHVNGALDQIRGMVSELALFDTRMKMAEFGEDAYDLIMNEINQPAGGNGILFGWPYLDAMVNGLKGGDVVSYVGRPAVGKTWKMIYSAMNAWRWQHKTVMVLSMEMNILSIAQRLAAIDTSTSIASIKSGLLLQHNYAGVKVDEKADLSAKLKKLKEHPVEHKLHLIDGNLTSTPQQIFALAHQLKPDVIFIDGAYLLKHQNPRLDRYTRVAENIEEIKRLTSQLAIPTICSYQFNRAATKKKKNEEVSLEDIGYSDAIGQISSVVLGLFEEESVETLHSRNIRVLKGRDGAVGQFAVNWDFDNMDFSQVASDKDKEKEEAEQVQPLEHI
jgi:replicative DNA helicase